MSLQTALATPSAPAVLLQRWTALRGEQPGIRARDAAARLGVSEAELVASRCGDGAVRLRPDWGQLVQALPGLGTVMVLTRNEHVVHEKIGRFDKISVFRNQGLVLNEDIDLRIFFGHWHHGFALREPVKEGVRRSLQFFDADGTAVHKIYPREDAAADRFDALVEAFRHEDQSPALSVQPADAPTDRPDAEVDAETLRQRWLALQDTHDFFFMLKELSVGRQQAFRLAGEDLAYRVAPKAFRAALYAARDTALPIMIFVASPGVVQIHTGPVHRVEPMGPWLKVLDPTFNLHCREDRIAEAWIVRKPTCDGIVTSLELFADDGVAMALMFGKRKRGEPESEAWRTLVASLPAVEI